MTSLFYFYEALDEKTEEDPNESEPFYVQCEWFNETLNLDGGPGENQKYCLLTVTDLNDYWQATRK